jgi:hypothetical protein
MEKTPGTALSRMDPAEVRVQNFMVVCGGLSIFCFVRLEEVCCLKCELRSRRECHNQSQEAELKSLKGM